MKQAPHTLLATGALLLTLIVSAAILLALRAPLLGIDLTAEQDALRVTSVAADSPNRDRIAPDSLITEIAGLAPDANLLIDDPDRIGAWAQFNALLDALARLHAAAADGAITATVDGEPVALTVRERRMADLPALFWIQLILSTVGFLIALGVFAFRPRDAGTLHFMQLGVGLMIAVSTHAVFSTRELIIDGTVFGWLSRVNSFGMLLFSAALPALLSVYPRRIRAVVPLPAVYYGIALATWLAVLFQVTPDTTYLYMVPLAAAIASFLMATLQWRGNHDRPLERAALKWFLLAILIGTGSFTAVEIIPPIFGHANAVSLEVRVAMGMVLVLSLFVGILLGITRYRLFELERWWFTAWIWFLGGFAVIVLDVALVALLGITQTAALTLSLALVGWLYFPLRQWLWSKFAMADNPEEQQRDWLRALSSATDRESLQRQWRAVLQQAYSPLRILETGHASGPHIEDEGQTLIVPNVSDEGSLRLSHAANGGRLFTRNDIRSADTLLAMARVIQDGMQEREHRILAERQRIRRDLHDDLGAKLLSMVYRTEGATQQLARSAIDDMRGILTALDAEPLPLEEALTNWRAEAQERAETHGFTLDWQDNEIPAGLILNARQHTNLGRILREAISNAVRHAETPAIAITFSLREGALDLAVNNQGRKDSAPPERWNPGLGILQITRRAADLGGTVRWDSIAGGHSMQLRIPLEQTGSSP